MYYDMWYLIIIILTAKSIYYTDISQIDIIYNSKIVRFKRELNECQSKLSEVFTLKWFTFTFYVLMNYQMNEFDVPVVVLTSKYTPYLLYIEVPNPGWVELCII